MNKQLNNSQQLEGILSQFDDETICDALDKVHERDCLLKTVSDFDDPGPEIREGTDGRIGLEDEAHVERIIREPNFLPASFLENGSSSQRPVARIAFNSTNGGRALATGFLVSPSLLMTNNHVIPSSGFAKRIVAQFNYQLDQSGNPELPDIYSLDPDDVFYTNSALDYSLVRVASRLRWVYWPPTFPKAGSLGSIDRPIFDPIDGARDFGDIRARRFWRALPGYSWGHLQLPTNARYVPPVSNSNLPGQHINIVQHPRGRRKEVALQRNNLERVFANHVRYTTDTDPGSSGSPVFDNEWDLLAVHHAGGARDTAGNWLNNQGVRIDKIVDDLRAHFSGSVTGQNILSELGL